MRSILNRRTATVGLVAGVAAVALAAPSTGQALFDANNAHKVDGYHAVQLGKITYGGSTGFVDDFDSCTFVNVYQRQFTAPRAGILALVADTRAERDFSVADQAQLETRLTIDGVVVSGTTADSLDNNGTYEGSTANTGAKRVSAGAHTIAIQARECSAGKAFIMTREITATWGPFGSAGTPPNFRVAPRQVQR